MRYRDRAAVAGCEQHRQTVGDQHRQDSPARSRERRISARWQPAVKAVGIQHPDAVDLLEPQRLAR